MPEHRLPRQVWEELERSTATRRRGRPRLTWASSLKKAMRDLELAELPWDATAEESNAWINEATKAAELSARVQWAKLIRETRKLDMFADMNVPFGFKDWLRGPTTPASSYLVRFRAGCPPIGEELRRRRVQTEEDDDFEESGICPACTMDTLETRAHFLVDCPAYTEARKVMMSACKGVISQESWKASESLSSEKRAFWLLSGCRDVPSDGGNHNNRLEVADGRVNAALQLDLSWKLP